MTIKSESVNGNWKVFPLVFVIVLVIFLVLGGIVSVVMVDRFFPTFRLFNQMIFLSVAVAIGVSAGNKIMTLSILPEHQPVVPDQVIKAIKSMGFDLILKGEKFTFRNKNRLPQLFSDWLRTEHIILEPYKNGLKVTGPSRYISDLTWKLEKPEEENSTLTKI